MMGGMEILGRLDENRSTTMDTYHTITVVAVVGKLWVASCLGAPRCITNDHPRWSTTSDQWELAFKCYVYLTMYIYRA